MPTGVYERKHKLTDEERKANKKAYNKKYQSIPENKKKKKTNYYSDESKKKNKAYTQRHEVIARKKKYQSSPESKKNYKEIRDTNRFKVLQHYSKTLSNSDIPCCNCCGLDEHMDFLALDHIAGKKQMDFESELVKLGYSSKLKGEKLLNWIIKNDFPEGFQILCHNCNHAKFHNNNECPHETMEWNGQFDSTTAKEV